jgi:UDP-2-acetamido-3-amino-2,3-dideoxy-glucuronate N-acetyltransferase
MNTTNGKEKRVGLAPRIAVFGCGYWGKNLVRNLNHLGSLSLVCDPSEEGRRSARKLVPDVEVTADFEWAMDREDIDAIVIATPAETHHRLAMRAMEAGNDVFVEKPLALNYRQGLEMEAQSEATGRLLMVGHLLEYHPAVLKLRELLQEGVLGQVNYIYSNRLNFGKVRTEENALWSFAPHDVAVILRLVGEMPVEVTCMGGSYITPELADVTMSCLHFRSGLKAHVFVSWLNPFKEQKLVVVGDRQMAVFNDLLTEGKLTRYNQQVEVREGRPVLHTGVSETVALDGIEPLRSECEHFIDCVRTRRQPLTNAASGIRVLRVLQACQESLENNGNARPVMDVNGVAGPALESVGDPLAAENYPC